MYKHLLLFPIRNTDIYNNDTIPTYNTFLV